MNYRQKVDTESQEYKDKLRRMQNVAESRRNMKVDLRPAVVAKTMTKELILVSITLVAVISKYCHFSNFHRSSSLLPQDQTHFTTVSGAK
jgi:hypothetical protein